ncbi:protein tesmin/TSO1-like CXC 2 [Pyrus ussuriensis x Pyrus communis]|uniref:Protein tesmin/TSO1-like CXC 2 n=1 Tax=Pyrus ussuriensis x Pyrus communis TaxID=2448454 RepID=A0A5N5FY20_9ROSA|nr:protein tesmin/TSO1-like CXC 2 [Pyrus ussuriensis x Pyrus communis]
MTGVSSSRTKIDEYKVWKMHDRALMHLITTTLSPSTISCAIGNTSARDLWVRLQEQFSIVSRATIFQMKSNLYTIKKGTDSMTQYLQRIKEARDFHAAAGVTFADEDIIILALNGLPSEYNTFRLDTINPFTQNQRNRTYSSAPPMTIIHTSFTRQNQSYTMPSSMPSHLSNVERIESMFVKKLEIVATKKATLSIELYDLQNHTYHTPLTPSFQCSNHEINVSPSLCHSTSYLPSLESNLNIKSLDEKSTRFPLGNSETGGVLLETKDYDNIGKLGEMYTLSRLCDGASIVDLKLITDKGGCPKFLFRSIYLGCTLRMIFSFLIAGLLSWLSNLSWNFLLL